MIKQIFYDTETTGTNSERCAIHQLSGVVVIDGKSRERFNIKMRPFDGAEISQEALDVAGVTKETIMAYPSMQEGYRTFISILEKYVSRYDKKDKFFLVGYNNRAFDDLFLRKFFERNNDMYFGSWFWSNSIDVMVLAAEATLEERHLMDNFKQGTVAQHLGITVDESSLHDALYDVVTCMRIYKALKER